MPKTPYKLLGYSLPPEPADVYSSRAIAVLKQLKQKFPDFYLKFRAPSEVLTLSGVRAFDTYYDLGKDVPPNQIDDLKKLLLGQGILYVEARMPIAGDFDEENCYSLVHLGAIADIPNRYQNALEWYAFDSTEYRYNTDFFFWWQCWKERISSLSYGDRPDGAVPKNWVDKWSVGHDLTFGMLLGYPGEAICSAIEIELIYKATGTETPTIEAAVAHATEYDGAWPQYYFEKNLADNPNIVAHQRLWSDILNQVYAELEP